MSDNESSSVPKELEEPPSKWDPSGPEWQDWKWQMANRLTSFEELKRLNIKGLKEEDFKFPLSITPYYATLLQNKDINYPLCKTMIPSAEELVKSPGEEDDPLCEDDMSPVPGLVHRYPDRVLLLTTNTCASYCRYCTRSRTVGTHCASTNIDLVVEYISSHPLIRDVILSGGDPLTLQTKTMVSLLTKIKSIPHIDVLRIGTKAPVVMPQRIDSDLIEALKAFHPLYINIHFTHPDELTPETIEACRKLAKAGMILGSQTVLLKGVNDDAETIKKLVLGLVKIGVVPRYLYQCDPITGSKHFRTPIEKGIEIIDALQGFISGFAVPKFVIDAPKGGGKIPVGQTHITFMDDKSIKLRNYLGKIYEYPTE